MDVQQCQFENNNSRMMRNVTIPVNNLEHLPLQSEEREGWDCLKQSSHNKGEQTRLCTTDWTGWG